MAMPSRRAFLGAALFSAAAVALGGCASSGEDAGSASATTEGAVAFIDDLGYEVTVASCERVVACMGSFANAWELAGGALVGATDDAWENYDIVSADAASVGRSTSLNLESILACDPDFVIMTGTSSGKHDTSVSQDELKAALDASGIPVAFFTVTVFADYLRMLGVFCSLTGRDDLYEENGLDVQERIEDIIEEHSVADRAPSVLVFSASSKGVSAQDSDTMTGCMLSDLGAVNLIDQYESLLSDFSMESVLEIDPDYLFVLAAGSDEEAAQLNYEQSVESDPAWSQLTAVQEGRSTVLDTAHFLQKPNANWDESYLILAEALAK